MRFYLAKGSIWTANQAEAKAAQGGTDYETIEVPTDKPSLQVFLNGFLARFGGAMPSETPTGDETHITVKAGSPRHPAPDCPACQRDKRIASQTASNISGIYLQADIEDIVDPRTLDKLIRLAKARKAVLEAK